MWQVSVEVRKDGVIKAASKYVLREGNWELLRLDRQEKPEALEKKRLALGVDGLLRVDVPHEFQIIGSFMSRKANLVLRLSPDGEAFAFINKNFGKIRKGSGSPAFKVNKKRVLTSEPTKLGSGDDILLLDGATAKRTEAEGHDLVLRVTEEKDQRIVMTQISENGIKDKCRKLILAMNGVEIATKAINATVCVTDLKLSGVTMKTLESLLCGIPIVSWIYLEELKKSIVDGETLPDASNSKFQPDTRFMQRAVDHASQDSISSYFGTKAQQSQAIFVGQPSAKFGAAPFEIDLSPERIESRRKVFARLRVLMLKAPANKNESTMLAQQENILFLGGADLAKVYKKTSEKDRIDLIECAIKKDDERALIWFDESPQNDSELKNVVVNSVERRLLKDIPVLRVREISFAVLTNTEFLIQMQLPKVMESEEKGVDILQEGERRKRKHFDLFEEDEKQQPGPKEEEPRAKKAQLKPPTKTKTKARSKAELFQARAAEIEETQSEKVFDTDPEKEDPSKEKKRKKPDLSHAKSRHDDVVVARGEGIHDYEDEDDPFSLPKSFSFQRSQKKSKKQKAEGITNAAPQKRPTNTVRSVKKGRSYFRKNNVLFAAQERPEPLRWKLFVVSSDGIGVTLEDTDRDEFNEMFTKSKTRDRN